MMTAARRLKEHTVQKRKLGKCTVKVSAIGLGYIGLNSMILHS